MQTGKGPGPRYHAFPMAKAQSKTSKKTKSKPAAKPTKKKVAKAAVKKPAAKTSGKAAIKSAGKASKPAAKKTAKVATKASKAAAVKKSAAKSPTKVSKAPAKPAKAAPKAAKSAVKAAKSAPKKSAASTRKPKAAAVATAAETTQVMEELLAHATAGDGQPTAPQHRDAAASLVTDEHELDAEIEGPGHQDDDENFDGHDDMDDASFNDRGTADSEPAGRPTYVDDGSPFPVQLARLLHDDKCTDIVLLDLRGVNPMWDYVIIGSGTSDRQMRSVLTHVAELGRLLGHEVYRRNVDDRATWLLADFSDVIVHLFEPNTRAHYDLEMLWGDATRVEWERPAQLPRNRAGLVAGDGL